MNFKLIILILFVPSELFAQYRTLKVDSNKQNDQIIQYDSLYNMEGNSDINYYKRFIGQELLFYSRSKEAKALPKFYANFESRIKIVSTDTIWYKKRKKIKPQDFKVSQTTSCKYNPTYIKNELVAVCGCSSSYKDENSIWSYTATPQIICHGYFTPFESIENKTFKILDIIKLSSPLIEFTLISQNKDTVYWYVEKESEISSNIVYPCIIKGFMEKSKSLYLNKEFYKTNQVSTNRAFCNLLSDNKYYLTELVFLSKDNCYTVPAFILSDKKNKEITLPLCQYPDLFDTHKNYTDHTCTMHEVTFENAISYETRQIIKKQEDKKRETNLLRKYGKHYGQLIICGYVEIGMTEGMVLESWGYPSEGINKTVGSFGVHEQWCYINNKFLYFENKKLTVIQD